MRGMRREGRAVPQAEHRDGDGGGTNGSPPPRRLLLRRRHGGRDGDEGNLTAAENVGAARGGTSLHTPEDFGPLAGGGGAAAAAAGAAGGGGGDGAPPAAALGARAALLGGYLRGSRLLVLCGAGAGNRSASASSRARPRRRRTGVDRRPPGHGVRQDRDAVERAARDALRRGCSVVVDRMHLTADQRAHFVAIATECAVPCHALLLAPLPAEMESRVRHRTDHPGNVESAASASSAAQRRRRRRRGTPRASSSPSPTAPPTR